jgi:hypothetical protein
VIGGIGVPVESVVTAAFFDGIKSQAGNGCAGKSFYTRQSFLDAARAYPNFAKGLQGRLQEGDSRLLRPGHARDRT